MKDKEKQIEEMFNYLRECSNNAWAKGFDYAEIDNEKLREFLTLFPEDSVVLSREELEEKYEPSEKFMAVVRELEDLKQNLEDKVVLSKEELKRLETNYKIGLGKSQSWCKSLKNRIEKLENENFQLQQQLENKGKETAEKLLNDLWHSKLETTITIQHHSSKEDMENVGKAIINTIRNKIQKLAKQFNVEIKEGV